MKYEYQDYPTCPHCGHEEKDFYDRDIQLEDGNETTIECSACDKEFYVITNISYSFSTAKIECDDDKHEWGTGDAMRIEQETCDRWNAERFCGKQDWKPHALWKRTCLHCDADQRHYRPDGKDHAFNSTDPWQAGV